MALGVLAAASPARADEATDLVDQGNELARHRDYAPAIEKFKAADRLRPRAQNVCMIGLAYLRRQHLAQAEVYFGRCRARANAADPAPEWLTDAETALATQIASSELAAIDLRVAPAGAVASLRLSSFALDESFAPQIVHLPPGSQTITASASGFMTVSRDLSIVARTDQTMVIELTPDRPVPLEIVPPSPRPEVVPPSLPTPPPPPSPIERGSVWSPRMLAIGAGAAVGGVVLHALALRTRDALENPTSAAAYHDHEGTFDVERAGAISLYAVAAVAVGVGLYLRLHGDTSARIGATYTGDGGLVTIGWTR